MGQIVNASKCEASFTDSVSPAAQSETLQILAEIAQRHGTPTYAFDVGRLRDQAQQLKRHLPSGVDILYSLKANASLGICDVMRDCGLGADVASAGELATALAANFSKARIFVAGPFKTPATIAQLRTTPEAIVSVDSLSELKTLSEAGLCNRAVLRLRPDFGSCAVVPAGSESRFGFTCDELNRSREVLGDCSMQVVGFHVFAGSQVLKADEVCKHLCRALDLSLRAADTLAISPRLINLGGGFGIPYHAAQRELDLEVVGKALAEMVVRAAPAQLVLELGRYLVAQAGWYLTTVLGHQTHQGRPAVVVDGGVHQRADMCGLCLRAKADPPLVLRKTARTAAVQATDVLGCLSLPDDVLCESSLLPDLRAGDVLAFPNAGAYGIWSSPAIFHGSTLPVEVAFEGSTLHLMRPRKAAEEILADQLHVPGRGR